MASPLQPPYSLNERLIKSFDKLKTNGVLLSYPFVLSLSKDSPRTKKFTPSISLTAITAKTLQPLALLPLASLSPALKAAAIQLGLMNYLHPLGKTHTEERHCVQTPLRAW